MGALFPDLLRHLSGRVKSLFAEDGSKWPGMGRAHRPAAQPEEEITQRTDAGPVLEGGDAGISPEELNAALQGLEPLLWRALLPRLSGKRVLYAGSPLLSTFSVVREKASDWCVAFCPDLDASTHWGEFKGAHGVRAHYGDSALAKSAFDWALLPEGSVRELRFMTRTSYWRDRLRPGGRLLLTVAHPQARFALALPEWRARSSRTATFERLVERLGKHGFVMRDLREMTVSDLPNAFFTKHRAWQARREALREWPLLIGVVMEIPPPLVEGNPS